MGIGVAALYIIKSARIMLIWVGATVAERMFETDYIEKVYGKGELPPSLMNMVLIIGAGMLVFNALLVAGMIALTADFRGTESLLSNKFIRKAAIDSFVHCGIVLIMGFVIAGAVQKKKYFAYRTEGIRASRAAKELILAVSIPFAMVPFFSST